MCMYYIGRYVLYIAFRYCALSVCVCLCIYEVKCINTHTKKKNVEKETKNIGIARKRKRNTVFFFFLCPLLVYPRKANIFGRKGQIKRRKYFKKKRPALGEKKHRIRTAYVYLRYKFNAFRNPFARNFEGFKEFSYFDFHQETQRNGMKLNLFTSDRDLEVRVCKRDKTVKENVQKTYRKRKEKKNLIRDKFQKQSHDSLFEKNK